jgi:tetratricopeptide (TPR) repeat protein
VTLPERLANAALSYLRYLGMTLWPAQLGVLYPMPPHVDLAAGALAALLLILVSLAVLRSARRLPWLFTGWFWYVGTLVPVIGVVQVGVQSHADRYTYLPLIGVFIAVVWTVADRVAQRRSARLAACAAAAVVVAGLSARTWLQLDTWRDSETLYEHALAVAPENPYIHYNLATLLGEHGRHAEAVPHYRQVVRLAPELMEGWSQLALSLAAQGDVAEARRTLDEIRPHAAASADVHHAAGVVALLQGDLATAEREASDALRIDPRFERARELLRLVYAERKRRAASRLP